MHALKLADLVLFLSTLSLRRATNGHETTLYRVVISIHALLAESDPPDETSSVKVSISIHALLAESDQHESADDMY